MLTGAAAEVFALSATPPGLPPMNGTLHVTAVRPVTVMDNPGVVMTGVLELMKAVPAQPVQPIPVQAMGLHLCMTKTPGRVVLNVMNHIYSKSLLIIKEL